MTRPLVDKERLREEWKDKWAGQPRTTRCLMVWNSVNEIIGSDVPNLMTVAYSILRAQPHCVDNERIHGIRKLVENEKRQSMSAFVLGRSGPVVPRRRGMLAERQGELGCAGVR